MDISLDIRKTVDENAVSYFEKSKKAKKKLLGAEKAVEKTKSQLQLLLKKQKMEESEVKEKVIREKKWYEKFRWFISSENFLCVGGRDATTNEIVVKKHTEKGDVVFHTQMQGSPFFVVKAEGKKIGEKTVEETAIAVASFSRAWKLGVTHTEVFYVKPEQLSKTAKPGEFVPRGGFIILGKTTNMVAELKLAVGITKDKLVMCGPVSAVKKHCSKYIEISQGNEKTSAVAKKIKHKIGGEIDDIIRVLPSGGCKITQS
ncbi:hypothetical protein CMO88_03955 [Candidatus Woesearchaeota archaeon]|nr:hypothetical protein [Candidatus Woesearchaeota archaeon]|tara:strand:- start:5354 stop:6130 length:777 start_codon:yes stop_codon:yes gene_type:complete